MGRLSLRISAAAVVVGVAAGSGGSLGGQAGHASVRVTARGWTRTDLRAVTQPAAVGGRFVFYATRNRQLMVVALDARSGSTAWSAAASPSSITPGVAPALAVDGRNVIYLRKIAGGITQVVASDAANGREVWHSQAGVFTSWPVVCVDDRTAICVSGGSELLRFAVRSGKFLGALALTGAGSGRELGPGLYDLGQRTPEFLAATHRNTLGWRRPLESIFTLPGASTDWGWNFDRVGRAGLFVGSAGWPPTRQSPTRMTLALSRTETAGFRIADGSVAWRDRGSRYVCGYLPCVGMPQNQSVPLDGRGPAVGLRLRATGTMSGSTTGTGIPVASRNARVILEGISPASGRKRWSFDAGHNVGLITFAVLPPQVGANRVLLRNARDQTVAVNLGSGSRTRVRGNASGWCKKPILYKQSVHYQGSNGPIDQYVGQFAIFACDVAGRRIAQPTRVPGFVGALGARSNGLIAWTDTTKIVAAPAAR